MHIVAVLYKFGTVEEIGKNLGSYDYLLTLLAQLNKSGHTVTVVAPWVSWNKRGSNEVEGVRVVRYWPKLAAKSWRNGLLFKIVNQLYIWQTGRTVKRCARELSVDIVYVRQARETGYAVARIKDALSCPIVFQPITTWQWHFDESEDSWMKRIAKDIPRQRLYAQIILKSFDRFIVYDNAMVREYVELGADKNSFSVIPPAVKHTFFVPREDTEALREKLALPQDQVLFINVSRINLQEKGQLYMLEGFRSVIDQKKNARLIIVGPGTVEQITKLHAKISELQLEPYVTYLGSKPYRTLPEYMAACDIGVFPSIWFEAFGRTTIDMMSCGLPMITTNVGGMPEANIDAVTGLIVQPKDGVALGQAMLQLVNNVEMRHTMSKNARARVVGEYTFAHNVELFDKVFTVTAKL